MRRGLGRGLEFAPGTTYNYSNMNFCALGVLIEAVTGQDYLDAVYERLLTPLGITGHAPRRHVRPRPDWR